MADVKIIGQMDNTIDHTFESANRVYDVEGVAPTMNTCGGGGLQPKILEDMNHRLLGGIGEKWGNKQYRQGNRVYDSNGVAMALTAQPLGNNGGNSYMYLTEEKSIVAMRGRNPDNTSDRTVGSPTEQRLEVNMQGTSNCLTSVQKDNMVLENLCVNDRGFLEKEPQISDGMAPTLRAETHGNLPKVVQKARGFNNGGSHDLCPPISASSWQENNFLHNRYRIRKLTPRECGRLMGVSDEDISKMVAVNSNTQLYKQFGNSIVVDVMCAMFKNLNIEN